MNQFSQSKSICGSYCCQSLQLPFKIVSKAAVTIQDSVKASSAIQDSGTCYKDGQGRAKMMFAEGLYNATNNGRYLLTDEVLGKLEDGLCVRENA